MKNKVITTGLLIGIYEHSEDTLKLRVLVLRQNHSDSYVSFIYKGSLGDDIHIDEVISIEGTINGYSSENDTSIERQCFIANKVTRAEGNMKKIFGLDDHFTPEHEFRAFLEGTVDSVEDKSADNKILTILVDDESGRSSRVITGLFNHFVIANDFNSISVGDRIACYLDVQTEKKEVDGIEKTYEYLVIEDFSIY